MIRTRSSIQPRLTDTGENKTKDFLVLELHNCSGVQMLDSYSNTYPPQFFSRNVISLSAIASVRLVHRVAMGIYFVVVVNFRSNLRVVECRRVY